MLSGTGRQARSFPMQSMTCRKHKVRIEGDSGAIGNNNASHLEIGCADRGWLDAVCVETAHTGTNVPVALVSERWKQIL